MAPDLLARLRDALAASAVTEQPMFGGVCFMLNGNMLVGASKRGLLVRVGKDAHAGALARPHATTMEMRGREMQGYVFVDPAGLVSDTDLKDWVSLALDFVGTLPPKEKKASGPGAKRGRK